MRLGMCENPGKSKIFPRFSADFQICHCVFHTKLNYNSLTILLLVRIAMPGSTVGQPLKGKCLPLHVNSMGPRNLVA